MSAYPPPPPPPMYDPRAAKQYARMARQQAKAQRQMMRMQMRGMRRRSIVGPLVLLSLGIIFLLAQTGKLSWAGVLGWYAHWWPVVLIGAGIILAIEWIFNQQAHPEAPYAHVPALGGGVVFLLVLLVIAGLGSHAVDSTTGWRNHFFDHNFPGFDLALGDTHDADDQLSSTIADGGSLLIRNPRGDVSVTGSSDDGRIHVSVHKEVLAHNDSDAATKEDRIQPVFTTDGSNVTLTVASLEGGHDDLTVQVPRNTALTIVADHGDVDVQEIHAVVSISANSGEVNLSGIDGSVNAHVNNEDSSFSAHSVTGPLTIEGHAGDINLSDMTGVVTLAGDFMGTTHLEHVNGAVSFKTFRTNFQVSRIDGELEVGRDNISGQQILGPISIKTSSKDITLERVQGDVQIDDHVKGDVSVTSAAPLGGIDISNDHGSIDVGVPTGAGFIVTADTHNGDIENDFGLRTEGSDSRPTLNGTVGGGGARINVHTGDGDITVRKATIAPLPPLPPLPPKITVTPPSPAPKAPKAPKLSKPTPPLPPSN